MKAKQDSMARKQPDDLTRTRRQQPAKAKTVEATVAMWNDFNGKRGSFADEYSTL